MSQTTENGSTTNTKRRSFSGNNTLILLLLTSIVAHGILFSSKCIKSAEEDYIAEKHKQSTNIAHVHEEESQGTKNLQPQRLGSPTRSQPTQQATQQLPNWRLGTDCSSYDFECFAVARRQDKYLPYPFSLSLRKAIENDGDSESANIREEWSMETIQELPADWIHYLETKETNVPVNEKNYIYPPTVSQDEYQKCIDLAITQNKSTMEQIDELLSGDAPRLLPEPDTNMVAFTISDYGYVHDMLHDVFQMMDDIVGFSNQHFFLVAIDPKSAQLACKYGYRVVLWKADENSLRDAVANTKVIISHELTKRGIDYFFTEMDVWWIRSPKPQLVEFQKRHSPDDDNHEGKHVYFSGHQNNYGAPNIGVYAVKSDKYSEEYFRVCLDILKLKPETHDQHVMAEVHRYFEYTLHNQPYKFGGNFLPDGPPEVPTIQHPFKALYFSPHEVVADERPMTTQLTLAIHTLNGMPLQAPHGKKMVAKELGVYYGFQSKPADTSTTHDEAAGYYKRSGKHRRYLWLDTELRNNFYSISHPSRYHNRMVFEWTIAIMILIARKTNRILILPQIFDADMDAGNYYTWTATDYSKVADMVDVRETNFITNPKSWRNNDWPFESVANTALFRGTDGSERLSIFTQVSNQSSIVYQKVWATTGWTHTFRHSDWLDAWIGSFSAVPELDSAEVLLVNPDVFMDNGQNWNLAMRLLDWKKQKEEKGETDVAIGRMEEELMEIYDLLGFCWDDQAFRHTANKVSASDSCYGIGNKRVM